MHQAVVEVGTDICADVDEAFTDVSTLAENHFGNCRRALVLRWALQALILSVIGKVN